MRPHRVLAILCSCGVAAAGCGTYSLMRPADTLKAGQFDLGAGATVSQLGEAVPHLRLHVGLTDWMEVGAHFEVYSAFGEVRFGLLSSRKHGFALAVGVGGGFASQLREILDELRAGTVTTSLTLGRRWDWFELYLGDRLFVLPELGSTINTTKLGLRFTVGKTLVLGIEGGPTIHHGTFVLAEAGATIGLIF